MADSSSEDTWTYAVVTPDGIASGQLDLVVAHLASHGLSVVTGRLVDIDVPTMRRVYGVAEATRARPPVGAVRTPPYMYEFLFDLGPGCVLVLTRPDGGAFEAAFRSKGSTRPELAPAGTVRHFGENVILNLMHSPDNAREALIELSILVGDDDAPRLRRLAVDSPERLSDLLGIDAVRDSLPAHPSWEAISPTAILNRVRRRLVQWLTVALSDRDEAIDPLREANTMLAEEAKALGQAPTAVQRMRVASQFNWNIHTALTTAASWLPAPDGVVAGLDAVASLYRLAGERDLEPLWSLCDRGVYVAREERSIIEMHAYTFRPHPDLDPFYS